MQKPIEYIVNPEEISFLIKTESGGTFPFTQIIRDDRFDAKKNYIPKFLPPKKKQGERPCCGIIAFWSGAAHSQQLKSLPHVYKKEYLQESIKLLSPPISLRKMSKQAGITEFGPIYRADHFDKLAERIGLTDGKEINFDISEEKYIKMICQTLEEGYSIIIAMDVNDKGFPFCNNGNSSHWGLICGFYFIGSDCFFIVSQYNAYYSWNAHKLWLSNTTLPVNNPKFGKYYKDKATKTFHKIDSSLSDKHFDKVYEVKEKDLLGFAFHGYAIPASGTRLVFRDFSGLLQKIETNYLHLINGFLKTKPLSFHKSLVEGILKNLRFTDNKSYKSRAYRNYLEALTLCINHWIQRNNLLLFPEIDSKDQVIILKIISELFLVYAKEGRLELLINIRKKFASISLDQQDHNGQTSLMHAIIQKKFLLALWLLENGADEKVFDNQNKNCRIYLLEILTTFEKASPQIPKIFQQALEEKSELSLSNRQIIACIDQEDGFLHLHKILYIYFSLPSVISQNEWSFFTDVDNKFQVKVQQKIREVLHSPRPDLGKLYQNLLRIEAPSHFSWEPIVNKFK